MPESVRFEVHDRVAVITVDHPPVNALGPGVLEGLADAVARAAQDPGVDASVIIGAGSTFIAGADITQWLALRTVEQSLRRSESRHALLCRIEDSHKPVVAAIHGHALGGGLETALACHYRVALSSARIGQPEVQLGLIPGLGGTQRLPRLCGTVVALDLCTTGRPLGAAQARRAGLLDFVVDADLRGAAIEFARARAASGGPRPTRERREALDDRDAALVACAAAREALARSSRGARAPLAVVEAIEAAVTHDFDRGSQRERELFAECVLSSESRASVHVFFAEREAPKVRDVADTTHAADVRRAAVVGSGPGTAGIAIALANAGIEVRLSGPEAVVAAGLRAVRAAYDAEVSRGRATAGAVERAFALITPAPSFDGFGHLDLVIDAGTINPVAASATFAELGRVTHRDCLLAANSSTLDVEQLGKASGRARQVIGLHFLEPAHVSRLVEIARGPETSHPAVASALGLMRRLGKLPIVTGNDAGLAADRLFACLMDEACRLVEEGAAAAAVDRAMTAFGFAMGPFALEDVTGLDVAHAWRDALDARAGGATPRSSLRADLVERGRIGQRSGAGWYVYSSDSREPQEDGVVGELASAAAERRRLERRDVGRDEIVSRLTEILALEGARLVERGTAARASDIDVACVHAFGFPRHRGGPMFHADTLGLGDLLERATKRRDTIGDHWTPPALLELLVAARRGFVTAPDQARASV